MKLATSCTSKISDFLIVNIFIFDILAVTISSEKMSSVFIKVSASVILYLIIFIHYKIEHQDTNLYFSTAGFRKLLLITAVLFLFLLITITYSENKIYGLFKISNFIISTAPSIVAFYYLLITISAQRLRIFTVSLFIESFILIAAILIVKPFYYDGQEIITFERWSHIIFGHFIGPVYFIFLFMLTESKTRQGTIFFALGLIISLLGVYISGMRAALSGVLIFSVIFFLVYILKEKNGFKKISKPLIILPCFLLLIYLVKPMGEILNSRYNYFDTTIAEIESQPSIDARLKSLEVSWDIFKQKPFLGVGFGGFRSYSNDPLIYLIKYPHNIFIEFLVETGIPGFLFFIYLLYLIFNSTKKISWHLTIFFLFALWLALFSKDIPSNILLWLGLAFIPFDPIKINNLKLTVRKFLE